MKPEFMQWNDSICSAKDANMLYGK